MKQPPTCSENIIMMFRFLLMLFHFYLSSLLISTLFSMHFIMISLSCSFLWVVWWWKSVNLHMWSLLWTFVRMFILWLKGLQFFCKTWWLIWLHQSRFMPLFECVCVFCRNVGGLLSICFHIKKISRYEKDDRERQWKAKEKPLAKAGTWKDGGLRSVGIT